MKLDLVHESVSGTPNVWTLAKGLTKPNKHSFDYVQLLQQDYILLRFTTIVLTGWAQKIGKRSYQHQAHNSQRSSSVRSANYKQEYNFLSTLSSSPNRSDLPMSYNIYTYVKQDLLAGLQEWDRLSFHRQVDSMADCMVASLYQFIFSINSKYV